MKMIKSWRWYGEHDTVSLDYIKQAGVSEIVTSLHYVPYGAVWKSEDIAQRQAHLQSHGLNWLVTESVPVHEDIKTRTGNYKEYIENYKETLRNLSACGIKIVCYNFMPVMDWTRTDLTYRLANGATTLHFDWVAFAAFDCSLLKRADAENDYSEDVLIKAKQYLRDLTADSKEKLMNAMIANLPGTDEKYSLEGFREALDKYKHIDRSILQNHLALFLQEVIPVAEEVGISMCIHPDDPPFGLLGLPRVVSTLDDLQFILEAVDSRSNGITFCTGSLGVRKDNDLALMFKKVASKVHFIHLRSTRRDEQGNFHEAEHLDGDVDMYNVVKEILLEQKRRENEARTDARIPMRPDHGHQMMDDLNRNYYPGYSCIGRMKGLAELTGLEYAINRTL